MHCRRASEVLSERLDSTLSSEESGALESHLANCQHCAEERRMMQLVSRLFDDAKIAEPPPQLATRVMTRVHRHNRRVAFVRIGLIAFLAVIFCLAACLTALLAPSSPLSNVASSPSLVSTFAGAAARMLRLAGTLLNAMGLIAQALIAGPGYTGLIGLAALASLLITVWVRVVLRVSRQVSRRTS